MTSFTSTSSTATRLSPTFCLNAMKESPCINRKRFPQNVEGPFYTTGHQVPTQLDAPETEWMGDCLTCLAPEAEAPDLLAKINENNIDTYFVRQPRTAEEISRACMAAKVCCISAIRYGGIDRSIIRQLDNSPEFNDYIESDDGELIRTIDENGNLLPFAEEVVDALRRTPRKWWQFWR